MNEINLMLQGCRLFSYEANNVPKDGEYLDVKYEDTEGKFVVEKVTHRIAKNSIGGIIIFSDVELKSISE